MAEKSLRKVSDCCRLRVNQNSAKRVKVKVKVAA